MINTDHKKKLIDGVVSAMALPKAAPASDEGEVSDEEIAPEEGAEEPGGMDEGTQYASDAMRAMENNDAEAFREAILGIMGTSTP